MQVIAAIAGKGPSFTGVLIPRHAARTVEWIAHKRIPGRRQVDPNLVRPSGGNLYLQNGLPRG